jgi:transposase
MAKGKNKKAAIVALCNKLLKLVLGCIKNRVKFQDNYQVNYC